MEAKRKRLYEIIEVSNGNDALSKIYDFFMMGIILCSMIPLAFKTQSRLFTWIETAAVVIFILDYIFRLATADYKLKKGAWSFLLYPFTLMALIDLISILPSLFVINESLRLLRLFRLVRTFRVFRIFKAFRYSKNISLLISVFKKQKDSLIIVCCLAIGYILISALIIFNVEPETFEHFFDAIYWATVSLTTVGYGDIYAVSMVGKVITMVSSVFGIAIVALPAGIITAGYISEIEKMK